MMTFFWSSGHIGWPLFAVIVFSVLILLATDIVWRMLRIQVRRLLCLTALFWVIGVAVAVSLYLT
jgi:hypothetical protein